MPNTFHTGGQPDDQLCEFRDDQSHDRLCHSVRRVGWMSVAKFHQVILSLQPWAAQLLIPPAGRFMIHSITKKMPFLNISKNWQITSFDGQHIS